MATVTGKTMGGYEILQEVGRGAMGVVFKAKQTSMDRVVALKFLPKSMAQQDRLVQRFVREARAAGKLSHPNIVAVHDVGQMDGLYFISMEFVDGTTAHKLMQAQGPFREEDVLDIGLQIAAALKEAHHRGILHRDVKPDNFLIDKNKRAKLADLGMARIEDDVSHGHLTQDGSALGTPHYMSPEQASGTPADVRSDLYSLGASLYVLASGETPFAGKTAATIMVRVIQDSPTSLKQLAPDLSPGLVALIEKLMQKDPAKRFQNAQETLEALGKVKSGAYVLSKATAVGSEHRVRERRAPLSPAQSSPALYISLGVGAAALALALVFGLASGLKPASNPATATTDTNTQVQSSDEKFARKTTSGDTGSSSADPVEVQHQVAADKSYADLQRRHNTELATRPAALASAWDGFLKAYPNVRQVEQAKARSAEARSVENRLNKEWTALQDEADQAVAGARFREALGILREFAQAHAAGSHGVAVAKKLEAVLGKCSAYMKTEIEKVLALADSDRAAAREQLDQLKLRMPDSLELDACLSRAYEQLAKLERSAIEAVHVVELADAKLLEVTLQQASKLVLGDEPCFQFGAAIKVLADASVLLKTDHAKIGIGLWAERYKRAGLAWTETLMTVGSKPLELAALGSFSAGKVIAKNNRGLVYKPDLMPLEQPVSWKAIRGEQALALVSKAREEKGPDATALEHGLLAYAVGDYRGSVKLLGRARTVEAQMALADEPYARALKKLDEEAKASFAAALAAYAKKDTEVVRREAKLLLPPGELSVTEFAVSKEGELRRLLEAQPAPAVVAQAAPGAPKKDGTEELKRVGWESVGGEWSLTDKKGTFRVKDGYIKVDAKNAMVSLTAKLSANAKMEVMVRRDEGSIKRTEDLVNGFKLFAGGRAKVFDDAIGRMAEGYGVILEGTQAKVFTSDSISGMPGAGAGRRPGGGRFGGGGAGLNPLIDAPLRVAEWDLQGETHVIEVNVKDNQLDIKVDAHKQADSRDLRDTGEVYIKIVGEAVIYSPLFKRP